MNSIERLLEIQTSTLKMAIDNHNLIIKAISNELEKDKFLNNEDVAEITGHTVKSSREIIQKINRYIRQAKGKEHVIQGKVPESIFWEWYGKEAKNGQ